MARGKNDIRTAKVNPDIENRLNGGDEHSAVAKAAGPGPNWSPTTLIAGDIAFVAFQSDNSGGGANADFFQFVLLRAMGSGTTIYFTDNGFRTDSGLFRNNEDMVRWVAQTDLPAGTLISFSANTSFPSTAEWTGINDATGATLATASLALSAGNAGDNIFALVSPSFGGTDLLGGTAIAAITLGGSTFASTWTAASGNTHTALPPGLTDGVNAVSMGAIDNGRYNGTTTGTATQLLAAINNDANWTTNNNPLSPHSVSSITIQDQTLTINDVTQAEGNAGTTAFTFTVTRSGGSAGAVGATWTLTLSGAANSADFTAFPQTGTVSFADTVTTAQITINVQGDVVVEPDEAFTVVLSAPTGGVTLTDATGDGTITNDDVAAAPPSVDLDGATGGNNYSGAFTEHGSAAIGNAIAVTQGTLPITGAVISITDAITGDGLTATGLPPTITVLSGSGTATLTLTGTGTAADWAAALAQVRYAHSGDNPDAFGTDTARTINVTLNDATLTSTPATATLAINAVNDNPVVTGASDDVTWTEGDAHVLLDLGSNALVSDVDNADFAGGNLGFQILTGATADDRLIVATVGSVTLSGNNVLVGGITIGTIVSDGVGANALVVALNSFATPARVQELARAVAYTNANADNPAAGSRPIVAVLTDGDGGSVGYGLNVNVIAVNDAAVIGGTDTGDVTEDGTLTASGTLTISDVDTGEAVFEVQNGVATAFGTFSVAANGDWDYDLNNAAVQQLAMGGTEVETIAVEAADGTIHNVTITIHGTNDGAILGGTDTGSVTEDGTLTASGTLTVSDADTGQSSFQPQTSVATSYGTFTLEADGDWSYALNNANGAVQALNTGQTLTDTIQVQSADGTTENVVITINGTDEGPGNILYVGIGGYATIQAAIDAAANGDTIVIADGTYTEQLSVNGRANLTIRAENAGGVTVLSPDVLAHNGDSSHYGGLDVRAVIAVNDSTNINIQGLIVDGSFSGDTTPGSNGDEISGIGYFRSSGSVVNTVIENIGNDPLGPLFGLQHGSGLFIDGDGGAPGLAVSVTGSTIRDFQKTGALIFGVDLSFLDNTIIGIGATGLTAQNGLQIGNAQGVIDGNSISGLGYTGGTYSSSGIIAYEPTGPLAITNNDITGTGAGSVGIDLSDVDGVAVTISGNDFDSLDYGLYAYTYTGGTLGLDTAPVVSGNSFANIGEEGLHIAPEESYGAPFTTSSPFNLTGTAEDDTLSGSLGNDSLDGLGGSDTLAGNGGNDSFTGGAGNDSMFGGAGTDTALVGSGASFVANGSNWTVTSSDGSDTLTGIEIVDSGPGGNTLLVGSGGFATLQEAINAASDGDTILVASGTYVEQITVNGLSNLTIRAATGATVAIQAPADVHQTATSSSGRAVNAVVTVTNGANIVFDNINVDGAGHGNTVDGSNASFVGIYYRNASGSLLGVDIGAIRDPYDSGTTVSGVQRGVGLQVDNSSLLAFTMTGGSIFDFRKNATVFNYAILSVTGVTVTGGGAQTINAQNGFQVSNSTGTISGNTITGIGYAGPADAYSAGVLAFGNTNLDILNNIIAGTNGTTLDAQVVGIYILDFGTPNSGGTISGNTISHVDIGIGVYGDIQPNGITVGANTITNIDTTDPYAAGVDFEPNAGLATPFDVTGTAGDDILYGAAGNDNLKGLGGDDDLMGNGGDDILAGGAGTGDTAIYAGARSGYTIAYTTDPVSGRVTSFTAVNDIAPGNGNEGSDTLSGIEVLQFNGLVLDVNDPVQLFDASNNLVGTFTSIQAAVDASSAGYTLRIAAGIFTENVNFHTAVTVLGAHAGDDGVSRTGSNAAGETTLIGRHDVTAATGAVTLNGLRFVNNGSTTGGGAGDPILQIVTGGGHVVTNSVFYSEVQGGNVDDRAISMPVIGSGQITISNNYFTGAFTGLFGTASWQRAVWFDGGGVDLDVTGNTFEYVRSGLNLDMSGDSEVEVSGNHFTSAGSGVVVGVDADGLTVVDNDFTNVGDDFSFRNLAGPVVFDAEAAVDALSPVGNSNDYVVILGGSGGDTLSGSSNADYIDANNRPGNLNVADADILDGRAGNDILFGRFGDDTLTGGANDDYVDGGDGYDTAVFSGNMSDYSVTVLGGGVIQFVDLRGGSPDGTDQLVGIERVVFADDDYSLAPDGTLTLINFPPVAVDDVNSATEDGAVLVGSVATNDSDPDPGETATLAYSLDAPVAGLTLSPNGGYSFDPSNAAYQHLAAGATANVVATYTVTDDNLATDTGTLTITVTGTNDAPVVTSGPAAATGSATEAISLDGIRGADQTANNRLEPVVNYDSAIVSLLAAHPNDMHAVLVGLQAQLPPGSGFAEAVAIVWDYVDDNFSYYNTVINEISARLSVEYALYLGNGGPALTGTAAKYTPDGADLGSAPDRYQSLHDNILGNVNGAGLIDKFLDSSGGGSNGPPNGTADQAAYDRIIQLLADNGLSDLVNRPVYSGTEGAPNLSLAYDQAHGLLAPATGGQLTATDVDDGAALTWSGSATGIYGAFSIAANGAWTYMLNQFDADTQALGAGESALDTFTATVSDGLGGSATQLVTITVFGTNDAPTGVANAMLPGGSEDVVYHVTSAQLLAGFSDLDGDTLSVLGLSADHGTVVAEPGGFAITLDPDYYGPVVLSYQVDDGNGGSTSAVQTFDVNGAPVVTGPVAASATEGGGLYTFNPLANASDPDGDSLVVIPVGPLPAGVSFVGGSAATIDFGDYALGSVVGQHGWTDATPSSPDNAIVDVSGNRMLRLANDPTSGDFGGPFSPAFAISAGEGGAAADTLSFSFVVKAVNNVADGSRLEIDLGSSDRDDRYNFMALEYTAGGLRLVQNTPLADPDGNWQSNNFDWGGNVQLGALFDASVSHTIQVIFRAVDGSNNDIVEFYVDGNLVGTGSTFENFAEFHLGQPHASAINSVNNVLFRAGDPAGNPFPADGPGGNRQGFYVDDLGMSAFDSHQLQFNANDPAYDHLTAGTTQLVTVNYNVADGHGGVTPTSTVITVTGTNDNAAIAGTSTGAAVESGVGPGNTPFPGTPSATGTLTVTDVDDGEAELVPVVAGTAGANGYGTFAVAADGNWTYTLNNADTDTNALPAGATVTDTILVYSEDLTASQVITVTITGTNDAPVAAADTNGGDPVVESGLNPGNTPFAGDPSAAGNVLANDTDVDTGDTRSVSAVAGGTVGAPVIGVYGSVVINANGSYFYTLNNSDGDTNAIAQGATATDVFTYTIVDLNGATSSTTLTITITGTNDAPVAVADTNSGDAVIEAGVIPGDATATGNVLANDTDVDTADTRAVSSVNGSALKVGSPVTGTYGSVTIAADGSYTYTLNNGDPDTNALVQGATVTEIFTYAMVDANGATSSSTLTITITGTNDAAVIGGDTSVDLTEADSAAAISTTGALTINDPDSGQNSFVTVPGTVGAYGTFAMDSAGAWTYTASSAHNEFAAGVTYTDTFTVASFDGTTQVVTINIIGTNDDPDAVSDVNSATEDGAIVIGNVATNDSDADAGDTRTYALDAPVAGLILHSNGSYSFDPSSYDMLALGATQIVVASYTMTDGQGATDTATLTITVTGINDGPDAVNDTASATEDGAIVTGNVATNDSDVDVGDTRAYTLNAPVAGLTLALDGSYSFNPASYDSLAFGATQNVVATYTLTDGQGATDTATLTITVTGINDAPDAVNDTVSATEDGAIVTGTVATNDTDVDVGDTRTYTLLGPVTGLILHSNGSYSFDASSYDSLAAGSIITLNTNYRMTDGQGAIDTATLTITVTGVNDTPDAVNDTASATEDGAIVNGTVVINDNDVDFGDTRAYTLNAPVAGLTLDIDGNYSFDPSSYDSLAFGATQIVVASYTMTDGQGATDIATLTITVTGVNDAPDAVNDVNSATEDGAIVTGNVATNDSDVDIGDTRTYTLNAPVAGLLLDSSGSYSFDPSSYDSLALGATQIVVATYTMTDGQGATDTATLTITVTGVNDGPDAVNDTASATEDGAIVTGSVATNDSDADVGDTRAYTLNAPVAGLSLALDGSYSFDPSSYDSLAFGATQIVVATYTMADGQGATDTATLTITVTGVNDAPDAVNDVNSATEDGAIVTGNVATNDSDVDIGDTRTYTLNAPVAGLTLDSSGSYSFDPASYDTLALGATQIVVASYTMTDGQGATDIATLTITVTGINDGPDAVNDVNSATEDGAIVTGTVATNDSDVDAGDTRAYTLNAPVAGLSLALDGSYSFDPSSYDSLALGATQIVVATYTMTDGQGATDTATLTITVTGVNDGPDAVNDVNSATEDGAIVIGNVATNDSDADAGDTRTYTLDTPVAGLILHGNGSYSFDPSSYDSLALGATQIVVASYTMTDGQGATDTATLTITVTGINDGPDAVNDVNSATEDGAIVTGNVATNDSDVDVGDTRAYTLNAPVAGLSFALDGSYSFNPASYDSLAFGATQNVVATYTLTEGQGATDTATLTITVTGINDGPDAVNDVNSATEDGAVVTGNVATNDSDVDIGDTRTYALNAPVAGLTFDSSGSYSFDPSSYDTLALGATQIVVATYTMTDGQGATDTATLTITVTGVDDAAVAQPDAFVTNEATSVAGSVFANNGSGADSDIDGPLVISAVNGSALGVGTQITLASGALLTLNADGAFSYIPNGAFNWTPTLGSGASNTPASDSFTYTVAGGNTVTVTIAITGLDTNDTLLGTDGDDTLSGGAGNDVYVVDQIGDLVLEAAGRGNDIILTSVSYVLASNQEVETLSTQTHAGTEDFFLTGNQFNNTLIGNAGDNIMNGVDGADVMYGLDGDDTYAIDNVGDLVVDGFGQGNDLVLTYLSHTLSNGNQIETLSTVFHQGTDAINLGGNDYDNTLIGNYGANYLNGNGGVDVMIGLYGDDTYVVDNVLDVVEEIAGGGTDALYSFVSYTLAAGQEVETISTAVQGGTTAINLTGNALAQTVIGNYGANVIDGKGGNDVLTGLFGADTFAFTTALGAGNVDTITDFVSGTDRIALDDALFAGIGSPGAFNAGAFVIGAAAADANDRIIYNQATGQLFYDADGNGAGAAILFATLQGAPLLIASDFQVI